MPEIARIIGMLDRDGALHLDDAHEHGSWPEHGEADTVHPIAFDSLGMDADQLSDTTLDFVEHPRGIRVDDETIEASLFNIKQSLWSIVPRGREPLLPMLPGALPLKTDRLERYVIKQGRELVRGGGKGSHAKYRRRNGEMIVLPHTKDVSRMVLSSTAQTLGLKPEATRRTRPLSRPTSKQTRRPSWRHSPSKFRGRGVPCLRPSLWVSNEIVIGSVAIFGYAWVSTTPRP